MIVERNEAFRRGKDWVCGGGRTVMVTPPLSCAYWQFRVRLHLDQAVVAFPKFMTYGIGFGVEDADWNRNLPFEVDAEHICDHIWVNRKYDCIVREQVVEAIRLLQDAVRKHVGGDA